MNTKPHIEKVNDYIVNWLQSYAQQSGVKGFVVGVSGGIDSAVVSFLCAQTGLETLCVEMPIHQAASQVSRGKAHIDALQSKFPNVIQAEIDLTATFEGLRQSLPEVADRTKLNLALANTRARLRMTTLYYYAGIHSLLVAGTGNKIEDFGIGFFTKYGDGGVDISPIADLMKSEVYALAAFLGVTDAIRKAPPTDGLFGDDRSDEDQIGANYDELEKAMLAAEQGKTADDFQGREKEVMKIYTRLNRINQHKVTPIPICIIPKELKLT